MENFTVFIVNQKENTFSPVLTKAKGKDEFCITASTEPSRVNFKNFSVLKIEFNELRKITPDNIGILLISENGGKYFPPQVS